MQNTSIYNGNTSTLYLENLSKSKCLFDEVNEYIKIMKKGEHFDKITNSKGRTTPYQLILSKDEKIITLIYDRCCVCKDKIYIDKISSCEIGHSNNFYSTKKFENFFTIELDDNQTYEFYHHSQSNPKSWVNCINYLIQKKKGKQIQSNDTILSKEDISNIWKNQIIPNWPTYRKYLLDKNKQNYFTKKVETNKKKMNKYLPLEENINILEANHQEILYLWTLGLPSWLRKYLWNIVIGNELDISQKLFLGYANGIFNESESNKLNNINNKNFINGIPIYNSNQALESKNSENDKEKLINDLKDHINFYYKKYEENIKSENKVNNFKTDIYLIVRCFCNYRQDILYTKEITELSTIIYLNTDNNFDAFRILCNFIIPSYLFNFIQNDVSSLKNYYEFFEKLMQKYTPLLFNYINRLNNSLFFVFYSWTKNLFLKVFPYNISLVIFDNFIIKGKIFIFQVALAILIINQKELINYDINELLLFLKGAQFNIDENLLFEQIDKLDIRKEYEDFFDIYELGKEKIELFQEL